MAQSRCHWRSSGPCSAETSAPAKDASRGRIAQAVDQAQQGRLAGAGAADDANHLAGGNVEAHVVDGAL